MKGILSAVLIIGLLSCPGAWASSDAKARAAKYPPGQVIVSSFHVAKDSGASWHAASHVSLLRQLAACIHTEPCMHADWLGSPGLPFKTLACDAVQELADATFDDAMDSGLVWLLDIYAPW